MFENFTSQARRSVMSAEQWARTFSQPTILTEHLLLALSGNAEFVSVHVLASLGVPAQSVSEAVKRTLTPGTQPATEKHVPFTTGAKHVFQHAVNQAKLLGHRYVGTEHLLLGLLCEPGLAGAGILFSFGITLDRAQSQVPAVLWQLSQSGEGIPGAPARVSRPVPGLPDLVPPLPAPTPPPTYTDLIAKARSGPRLPLVGREPERARLAQILCARPRNNNALLIGERAVGKSALIDDLAHTIVDGSVPDDLRGAALLRIEDDTLLSTPAQGLVSRVEALRIGRGATGAVVCVIDAPGVLDPANGRIDAVAECIEGLCADPSPLIVTVTPDVLSRLHAAKPALITRFDPMNLPTPTPDQAMPMVNAACQVLAAHYGIQIADDVAWTAVAEAVKTQATHPLPGGAVSLLGLAAAHFRSGLGPAAGKTGPVLDGRFVESVAARHRGAPA